MTDQPHQPYQQYGQGQTYGQDQQYEGYDAHAWPGPESQQPRQSYPSHQSYEGYGEQSDPNAGQYTQQWQGQTWETQVQPPVSAEETAYLPPHAQPQPQPQCMST